MGNIFAFQLKKKKNPENRLSPFAKEPKSPLNHLIPTNISGHDQVVLILCSKFRVPVEIVDIVFSYVSVTNLIDLLGAPFDKVVEYSKPDTFKIIKNELSEIGGYELMHDGTVYFN